MHPGEKYDDEEAKRRFKLCYEENPKRELLDGQVPFFREKWSSLSEYVKKIKQSFS